MKSIDLTSGGIIYTVLVSSTDEVLELMVPAISSALPRLGATGDLLLGDL